MAAVGRHGVFGWVAPAYLPYVLYLAVVPGIVGHTGGHCGAAAAPACGLANGRAASAHCPLPASAAPCCVPAPWLLRLGSPLTLPSPAFQPRPLSSQSLSPRLQHAAQVHGPAGHQPVVQPGAPDRLPAGLGSGCGRPAGLHDIRGRRAGHGIHLCGVIRRPHAREAAEHPQRGRAGRRGGGRRGRGGAGPDSGRGQERGGGAQGQQSCWQQCGQRACSHGTSSSNRSSSSGASRSRWCGARSPSAGSSAQLGAHGQLVAARAEPYRRAERMTSPLRNCCLNAFSLQPFVTLCK